MIKVFRQNKWFFVPYFIFLVIGGIVLLFFTKVESHWFINQKNSDFTDWFFKFYTQLGDGLVLVVVIPITLFIKYRYAIVLSISSLIVIIFVQLFKRYILPDLDRPIVVFQNYSKLHLVDGVDVHITHSFPSGHTATAFSIFLVLAIISNKYYLKFIFFLAAILVAYSRVYLSQHFLRDVYFGSLIGVIATYLVYIWSQNWKSQRLDCSLKNLFKTKKNAQAA